MNVVSLLGPGRGRNAHTLHARARLPSRLRALPFGGAD